MENNTKENQTLTLNELIKESKEKTASTKAPEVAASPVVAPQKVDIKSKPKATAAPLTEDNLKTVDVSKFKSKTGPVDPENKPESVKMMERLDDAIERKKRDIKARVEQAKAEIIEGRINGELKLKDVQDQTESQPAVNFNKPVDEKIDVESDDEKIDFNNKDNDNLDDMLKELEESDEVLDDDEINQLVKDNAERKDGENITKNIINTLKPKVQAVLMKNRDELDFSKFKIATRTIAHSKVLSIFPENDKSYCSTWALPNTGIPITIRELTGAEIELIAAAYSSDTKMSNRINAMRRMYNIIYNHVVDPNKPSSMEEWLKTISYLDMSHLSFALYKSSFETTNYLPYVCPNKKCNEADLVKINIEDMVEFKDEETKKKFYDILQKDPTSKGNVVEEHLIQISKDFAVGVRIPSIFTLVFENIVLDETFRNRYSQLLGYISFVSNIYKIDTANSELIPVDTKPDSNDFRKTVKNKIVIYAKILNQLTSDEYSDFELKVDKYSNMRADLFDIKYITPAHTCTKCKTEIEKAEADPMNLVFLRHRLIREIV